MSLMTCRSCPSHILLLRMLFGQRIERHRRGRGHGDGAKIAVIFIAPNAQHIAGLKVRLRCIANGDGFAPGEDVVLKTLKKVMSLACMI